MVDLILILMLQQYTRATGNNPNYNKYYYTFNFK